VSARNSDDELLDALPDPIIGIDTQHRVVAWNRAAEAVYGFTRAEALGLSAPELLHSRFPAPLAEILEMLADTGGWQGAIVHVDSRGREVAVDSRWSARRDENGRVAGALWVERAKPVEETAPAPRAAALEPHRLEHLGRVASTVAHDFNNLLSVIVNYSVLVASELEAAHRSTGEERWALLRSDVGEIRLAAERATQLSRELLAATRGDDDGVDLIGARAEPELRPCRNP